MASHKYAPVGKKATFIIEDDEDDSVEISLQSDSSPSLTKSRSSSFEVIVDGTGIVNPKNLPVAYLESVWNMLTFAWVKPLLELGNSRALEQTDLYDLDREDSAVGVYETFSKKWKSELKTSKPSVAMAYMLAFGGPFVAAGFLKLIHDSCIFISPMMLKHLISFLSDPTQPTSIGVGYVIIIFGANVMMSMCLRQYFYWCYLTGMRLRSAVITSIYNKSLVLGAAALSSRSSGEIMNLMSVDASRMQELTPYLHAIWYSFYQITVAVYFLWQQVSYAALSGIAVILILIPVTAKVSSYLKATQKEISKIRDERVKVTNEVLAGMKVIKFQAWEQEFESRIQSIRTKELEYLKKYMLMQSYSSALYTSIPLLVAIATFATYVLIMKEPLTIATALTSLALFDILRFPLAMLPNVLNNVIEARISLDRIQGFLLEADAEDIPNEFPAGMKKGMPLDGYSSKSHLNPDVHGVYLHRASFMNEKTYTRPKPKSSMLISTHNYDENTSIWTKLHDFSINLCIRVKRKLMRAFRNNYGSPHSRSSVIHNSGGVTGPDRMFELGGGVEDDMYDHGIDDELSDEEDDFAPREYSYKSYVTTQHLLLDEAEKVIANLEKNLYKVHFGQSQDSMNSTSSSARSLNDNSMWEAEESVHDNSALRMIGEENTDVINTVVSPLVKDQCAQGVGGSDRDNLITLALSRVNIHCCQGEVVAIVGQVGCGKTSILRALLGDMKLLHGDAVIKGACAYVSQKPFIQNATVKDNILFGLDYDEDRYMKALSISALLPDMEVLPAGDMTEIGERGINLSGGQKTRVAIARAVYNNADIYLLDDPLAAVDAHVGQHLYSKCIQKLADEGKAVVFITNGLQYTKTCNRIYVLKDGRVAESGTYNELMQLGQRVQQQGLGCSSGSGLFYDMINSFVEQGGGEGECEDPVAVQSHAVGRERVDSVNSIANAKAIMSTLEKKRGNLTSKEDRETGDVNMSVYKAYLETFGGIHIVGYVLLMYLSVEFVGVLASWWLSYWSEHSTEDPKFYLLIYVLINVAVSCASLAREVQMRMKCLGASTNLYDNLLKTILYAPMSFFDTTPLGRIVNRFTKDIYTLDESLPATIRMYIGSLTRVGGVLIYISVVTPFFMIVLIPIALFYRMCQNYYISTSRELSRLESVSRSPIYALFSETIDGMSTIRAYGAQKRFCQRNNKLLDDNQRAYYLRFSSNCWLAVRLEMTGTMIVSLAALTAVLTKAHLQGESGVTEGDYSVFAGMAGLAISLSLSITQSLNWSVRMASDMESQMVSVERVTNYTTQIAPEAAYTKSSDPGSAAGDASFDVNVSVTGDDEFDELGRAGSHMPLNDDHGLELPGIWPSHGVVEFRSVCLRYRPGLPLVLNNCSFLIKSQEKIGVVGRTGAGKSSLVTALLRLVELEEYSHIYIDDVDISTLGLKALRSKITVIPQDPVLFSGTIRNNLDPFNQYTDEQIWQSVRRLSSNVESQFVSSLMDKVEENGSNYSVGQRQLLCIARALLTKAKIIVMDEATAAIDIETDALIQKAIRTDFVHATCLTIAHRLNTIMDCDKVLVMDNGRAAEYDSPKNLLANAETMFSKLVENWEHANK